MAPHSDYAFSEYSHGNAHSLGVKVAQVFYNKRIPVHSFEDITTEYFTYQQHPTTVSLDCTVPKVLSWLTFNDRLHLIAHSPQSVGILLPLN